MPPALINQVGILRASCMVVFAASATMTSAATVVDLSQDLEISPTAANSPGALLVEEIAKDNPLIQNALVLEHGRIVVDYVRSGVAPETPLQAWSVTKSWTSLLIGIVLDSLDGDFPDLNITTLGDIWPYHDEIWTNMSDASFRQNVTIESLLTMTSGLVNNPDGAGEDGLGNVWQGGDAGGGSLSDSLALPLIAQPGDFSYLGVSNILSYALQTWSNGTSPREILEGTVLPALGINNSDVEWWQNADGIEYSYHGLVLTAHQMAKFGQLYLQGGMASPTKRIVSAEWITKSASNHVKSKDVVVPTFDETEVPDDLPMYYGYLFWGMNEPKDGQLGVGDYYCALGFGGQDICVHPKLQRVVVQQAQVGMSQADNLIIATAAFDESVVFNEEESDPGTTSSGTRGGVNSSCLPSILGCVVFWFLASHVLARRF